MDFNRIKTSLYFFMSETNLRLELQDIHAIEQYQQDGVPLKEELREGFEQYVSLIVEKLPSPNDLDNETIEKAFGLPCYEEQRKMLALLYFEAGKRMAAKAAEFTLYTLGKIYDHTHRAFFYGFELSETCVDKFIGLLKTDFEKEVLLKSRMMHSSREQLSRLCHDTYQEGRSEEDIIADIHNYDDGSYTELPLSVECLLLVCQVHNYWAQWCRLLEALHYYPLQGAMLYGLHDLGQFCELWKWQEGRPYSKVVSYLLIDKFYREAKNLREQSESNANNKQLSEKELQVGKELFEHWLSEAPYIISNFICMQYERLGTEVMAPWYAGKMKWLEGANVDFVKTDKWLLEIIGNQMDKLMRSKQQPIDRADLNTLVYYASLAELTDKEYVSSLAEKICELCYSNKYSQSLMLNDKGFNSMRSIYRCLDASGLNGLELIKKYRPNTEGFNVKSDVHSRVLFGDNFWLPILVLQCEETDSDEWFMKVMETVNRYAKIDDHGTLPDYYGCYYIAELIVCQLKQNLKDDYEMRLIQECSHLVFVLRVICQNNGVISDACRNALLERVDAEWEYEKSLLIQRHGNILNPLDEYIKSIRRLQV